MPLLRTIVTTIFCCVCVSVTQGAEKYATGLNFLPSDAYAALPRLSVIPPKPAIPLTIDLSSYMPPPGDQGNQGSCVGWAVAYAKSYQENIERIKSGNQKLMHSPSYIYNQIVSQGQCNSGSYIKDALNLIEAKGIPLLTAFPYSQYNCTDKPNAQVDNAALKRKAINWKAVNLGDTSVIQDLLANALPVILGIRVYDNFYTYSGGIYTSPTGADNGGHAIVVVGYDKDKNAYKLINSWGRYWGDNGYMWITPGALASITKEAYVIFDDAESYVPWKLYQSCLSNGQPRCCDHAAFAVEARLCASLPGLDRWSIYQWCLAQGKSRCCDHLGVDEARSHHVCEQ